MKPELNDRWNAVMPDLPARTVTPDMVDAWLALAQRSFIDEIDNFPAISAGTPPQADEEDTAILGYHYLRADDAERTAFLARVTARPIGTMPPITLGVPAPDNGIGQIWAKDHPAFAFDDTRFVIGFCNVPFGRAISGIFTRLSLPPPDRGRRVSRLSCRICCRTQRTAPRRSATDHRAHHAGHLGGDRARAGPYLRTGR
jgi:hypothetical protein